MLPTFCPLTIWTISLEFYRKPSILAADDFLGACYRKAMTPQKLWTLLFLQGPRFLTASSTAIELSTAGGPKIAIAICDSNRASQIIMPKGSRAKAWRIISPTWAKNMMANIWRKTSPIWVLQFPGKVAARNVTKNPRQIPRAMKQTKLSHSETLAGSLGAQQITRDLGHCEPPQRSSMFWLVVQEIGVAILTAIWTEVQITNRAIWKCDLSCMRQWLGGNSRDLGSAISNQHSPKGAHAKGAWETWYKTSPTSFQLRAREME